MADNLNITWTGLNSQSTVEKSLDVNSGSYFFEIPQYSQESYSDKVGDIRVYFTCTETSFKVDKIVYNNPTSSTQYSGQTYYYLGCLLQYKSGSINDTLYSFCPYDGGQLGYSGLPAGESNILKPNTLITSNKNITNNYLELSIGTYSKSGYSASNIYRGVGLRSGGNNNLRSSNQKCSNSNVVSSSFTQYFTLKLTISDKSKLPLPTYTGVTEFIYSGDLINISSNINISEETKNRCTISGVEYTDVGDYNLSFKINSPDQFAWEGIQGDTYSIPWKIKQFNFDNWIIQSNLKFKEQAYTGKPVMPSLSELLNNDIPKILNSNNIQLDYSDNIEVTDAAKATISIKKTPAILNNIYSYTNDSLHNPQSYNGGNKPLNTVAKNSPYTQDVKWVQSILYNLGYDIEIDGSFGSGTETIVKQFQADNGLSQTGEVDINTDGTADKMYSLWNTKKSSIESKKIILYTIKILVDAYIKLNNSWKKAKELYIKTNNGWKKAKELYIRDSSSWKKSI